MGGSAIAANFFEDRVAILAGEHEVENDQIGPFFESEVLASEAVIGDNDGVAGSLQIETNEIRDIALIFHNQNFARIFGHRTV